LQYLAMIEQAFFFQVTGILVHYKLRKILDFRNICFNHSSKYEKYLAQWEGRLWLRRDAIRKKLNEEDSLMKKAFRRGLSSVLALAMTLSLFVGNVAAATEDTPADPAKETESITQQEQAQEELQEEERAGQAEELEIELTALSDEPEEEIVVQADDGIDYSKYAKGVTVVEDENSPTGYTVIFVYEEQESYTGQDGVALGEIAKVEMISDGMLLFSYADQGDHNALDPANTATQPEDFDSTAGLYPAGGDSSKYSGKILYVGEMVNFDKENGLWGYSLPLPSGAYAYNYRVTDKAGNLATYLYDVLTAHNVTTANGHNYLPDPNNMPLQNTKTGAYSRSSMVYVPYSEKQGNDNSGRYAGKYYDRSVQTPIEDDSKAGTVVTDAYPTTTYTTTVNDKETTYEYTQRGIAVYLPNGYDKDRTEPYNVLYISHGAQTELEGNELRWMNEIALPNIMDNLIAEGKVEPFVVVSVDNKIYFNDRERLWEENQKIITYVEANYNVSKEASGRAYAGLSMGAFTTSYFLADHPEQFGYMAMWSGGFASVLTDESIAKIKAAGTKIQVGYGDWDYIKTDTFVSALEENGISCDLLTVPGSHDWHTWSLTFAEAAQNFFFQTDNGKVDYSTYQKGVTVEADPNSPTGYTATFIYEESADDYTQLTKPNDIVKVELYSDCMLLYKSGEGNKGSISSVYSYTPDEYVAGLSPAGGSDGTAYHGTMTRLGGGKWAIQIPLSSGAFVYNFRVTDSEGNQQSRLDDPNNRTLTNSATGIKSLSSMVYVGYDATKQGTGDYADRTVENPIADAAKKGTVETISYVSTNPGYTNDTKRGLAVYLPAGYDKDRAEPYPVLYLSHGTSGDVRGDELRWMNEGAVANIMDNLIAEGKTEPFVVVTMNNQDLMDANYKWNHAQIAAEQEQIFKVIEAQYNVSKERSGRAYAGLSAGGYTASNMLLYQPDWFSYYGIWSYANYDGSYDGTTAGITDETNRTNLAKLNSDTHIMLSAGEWDYCRKAVVNFGIELDKLGIASDYLEVPAAHDWENWQLVYAYAAENFLFKDSVDYSKYVDSLTKDGQSVTVEADANSPTGYTATFIYKQLDSYTGLDSNLAQVELYSDCMLLTTPAEQNTATAINADKMHDPDEFQPGMYNAGGTGTTTYYAAMTRLGNGLWGVQVPLSSGAFVYNFRVTDVNGKTLSRLDDPNNPTLTNSATGIKSLSSMVYVPYDSTKQGTGDYADRTVENPISDTTKQGKVETVAYTTEQTGVTNTLRGLAIYLPADYDADRTEAYQVLYLSHGASGDSQGNELRWMNEGAVANIMDNLIAQGKAESFVVVTMNNQDLGWNQSTIATELFDYIIPYVEAHYNVRSDSAGRAFAGLSMGGYTTSTLLANYSNQFNYYGIWSYANPSALTDTALAAVKTANVNILLGCGEWDRLLNYVNQYAEKLDSISKSYKLVTVPAAHDWECWQLLYAYAAENFFFKAEATSSTPSSNRNHTSSTAATVVTPPSNSNTANVNTQLTQTPSVTVNSNGEAVVDMTTSQISSAITTANTSSVNELVIKPTITGDASKVTVSLPQQSVSDLANNGKLAVTVASDLANVTIPNAGLAELAKENGAVTVSAEAAADNSGAVKIDVSVGGKSVDSLSSGITATLPAANATPGSVMVLVNADGTETIVKKSVVGSDGVSGLLNGSATVKVVDNTKTFSDMNGHWSASFVNFASSRQLFNGTSDTTFSPDLSMSRAMLSTVLWSLEGSTTGNAQSSLSDVASGAWYGEAVNWATSNGLITGYADGTFGGDDSVTREQLAVILYNYANLQGVDTSASGNLAQFNDNGNVSSWASNAMGWAVGAGLISGTGNNTLDPAGTATRAQVAVMMQNMIGLLVGTGK
jgi:enterochelin esterase-like enzyme